MSHVISTTSGAEQQTCCSQLDQSSLKESQQPETARDKQALLSDSTLFNDLLAKHPETQSSNAHSETLLLVASQLNVSASYMALNSNLPSSMMVASPKVSTVSASTSNNATLLPNLVGQISSSLSAMSSSFESAQQSFVISLPNHANIQVQTNMSMNGTRKFQLESDELKFQSWLETNKLALTDALSKELKVNVEVETNLTNQAKTSQTGNVIR